MRTAIIILVTACTVLGAVEPMLGQAPMKPTATTVAALGRLPLHFVENRGVYPDAVRYTIQGADKTLFFTDGGVTIALKGKERGWAVKLEFVGARPGVRPVGCDRRQAVFSYFTGAKKDWKSGLPSFASVVYRDLWPGIDLVYNGTVNKLKYEFQVAPGADPAAIRLRYHGADSVTATAAGALRVETPEGCFEDAPPLAWQEINGRRVPVGMAYVLGEAGAFAFGIGDYDRARPLVLDPAVLVYCGFVGGAGSDVACGVALDAVRNVYVTGWAGSDGSSFPVTVGPATLYSGQRDAFVAKVNAAGTDLIYCGYIGGDGDDRGNAIAVDGAGRAYVTGATLSTSGFPVTVGPDLTHNGANDAFVARVNAAGTALDYCGFIGGSIADFGSAIAVDGAGNAYVAGFAASDHLTFPVIVGPAVIHSGGTRPGEGFVAKVDATGSGLVYCGYIGGDADDRCHGIAVDAAGRAYVAGFTVSTEQTFPVKLGPDLTHNGGDNDAFVARVNAAGTGLDFCGYIGGAENDWAYGIALDAAGNAFVVGTTGSDQQTFPVVVGPDLTYNRRTDAYVAKVDANSAQLVYCGYIGGKYFENGLGIAVDAAGNAYVAGETLSNERSFPVVVGPDVKANGGIDAFVARVNAGGTGLDFCGYLGGTRDDSAYAVTVDGEGNAYLVGYADSSDGSFPVVGGPDLTHNGGIDDAFVARVGPQPVTTPPAAPSNLGAIAASSSRIDLTWADNAANETGFRIERSPDSATWAPIAILGADVTGFADTGLLPETTYYYQVCTYNAAGDSGYSNGASDTTGAGVTVDHLASGDIAVAGTVTGIYAATQSANNACQAVREVESDHRLAKKRYSYLEHKWAFTITAGSSHVFHLQAHRSASTDGDNFVFAYSLDGMNYSDMLTITKTGDDAGYQSFVLPGSLIGTVYIRVRDTNRTKLHVALDSVFIDHMFIRSE